MRRRIVWVVIGLPLALIVLGPWAATELFGNFGTGFHSNDARAVLANPKLEALPTATGYEAGFRSRVLPRTEIFATYWFLDLGSELVFAGDAGTTQARGPSHREGLEVGVKVRALDWLMFTGDFTYTTHAELTQTHQAVPLAPVWTARWDLTARLPWGLSTSLEMRYLGDRPADPDLRAGRHFDQQHRLALAEASGFRHSRPR